MPRKDKCINPNCDKNQHSRGLCSSCYNMANAAINAGDVTEQQLIAAGKMHPAFEKPASKRSWLLDVEKN